MNDTPRERLHQNATEITSMLVTGFWLVALLTGQSWWLAALLFGYVVVIPVVAMLFDQEDEVDNWWNDMWSDSSGTPDWWNGFGGLGEAKSDRKKSAEHSEPTVSSKDALETLRNRYANGELTDEQFERKLERLIETETMEDVEDRFRADKGGRVRERA
ncbi:SHOCT domain-containing protein [Haladaptatus caseinilyticus]|uniref:SHOCT domain-containing protein n=1 Tax=Haladaptatus caseinilyticus TaxID=2993314 RepID=UPI00224B5A73|nr:SHOCT domain-containing protein [Haladaptatus caseinilyticus]